MDPMLSVRVLITAEHLLVRTGLAAMLASQPGIQIIGQIALQTDADLLAAALDTYAPDVMVADLGDEPASAAALVSMLIEAQIPLVGLLDDENLAGSLAAQMLGDLPYALLPRETSANQLAQAVAGVAAGLVVFAPALAAAIIPAHPGDSADRQIDALTTREYEVLQLVAQGLANKAIAHRLGISPNTVKFHINAILSKLDAQSRTEAVMIAARLGFIVL